MSNRPNLHAGLVVGPTYEERPVDTEHFLWRYQNLSGCFPDASFDECEARVGEWDANNGLCMNNSFKMPSGRIAEGQASPCKCGDIAVEVPAHSWDREAAAGRELISFVMVDEQGKETRNGNFVCLNRQDYMMADIFMRPCSIPKDPPIRACPAGTTAIMTYQDIDPAMNYRPKSIHDCLDNTEMRCGPGEVAMDLPIGEVDLARIGVTYSDFNVYRRPSPSWAPSPGSSQQKVYLCVAREKYGSFSPPPSCPLTTCR